MKLKAISIALIFAMLLSGCSSVVLDAQTLMRPPRAAGEKESIHALLNKKAGDNLTLKYPHSGDYRSAIIMHDLSGDQQDEAIAFYQTGDEGSGINIIFMDLSNGQCNEIRQFHSSASQVNKVCFGDVNADGKDEAIVSWGSSINNTSDICIYSYSNHTISEPMLIKQACNEMAVMDFDGDGHQEIFTASVNTPEQPAIAKLLRVKNGKLDIMGTAHLDAGVTKYTAIHAGLLNENQYGVVLDGMKAPSSMVTEILYWDKSTKTLFSPFFNKNTLSTNLTFRNTSTVSQDINNDKIIEFPIVTVMPGYLPDEGNETHCITNWKRLDTANDKLINVMSTAINSADGYWLMIPDMWLGRISTKIDTASHSMTFFEWKTSPKNKKGSFGQALLKIQVFTEKEWSNPQKNKGYTKILEQNNIIYAAACPQPFNTLSMNMNDIKNSFRLISQD